MEVSFKKKKKRKEKNPVYWDDIFDYFFNFALAYLKYAIYFKKKPQ